MDYKQAINYIEGLLLLEQKRPSLPGLDRIRAFLSYYKSPQDSFISYHVGGTNGKGSTVAILDSILRKGPFKVGRFTGPHLLRFNERFHVEGKAITDDELTSLVFDLKQKSEHFADQRSELGALSWFEFLTVLAFFYFAEKGVDVAVIEVGLGGRFDATNVLQNLFATGITNIGLDHQNILGSRLEDIAMEKAGIIKAGVPIITAATEPALSVITAQANKVRAQLINSSEQLVKMSPAYLNILPAMKNIKNDLCQHGLYQYQNAITAVCMLKASDLLKDQSTNIDKSDQAKKIITIDNVLDGVQYFYWPGRFQIIESEQIILDGAHNPAGIKALRESLDYLFPNQNFHFIFGCFHDKDGLIMLFNLLKPGDYLYLVELNGKRSSFSLSQLAAHAINLGAKTSIHPDITQCLLEAKKTRKNSEFIVATGSFFLLKLIMQNLGWQTIENGHLQ